MPKSAALCIGWLLSGICVAGPALDGPFKHPYLLILISNPADAGTPDLKVGPTVC